MSGHRGRTAGTAVSAVFGKNLQRLRTAQGLSRAMLSRKLAAWGCAMSEATIYSIERGVSYQGTRHVRAVSIDEAVMLCTVLGTPIDVMVKEIRS